MTKLALIDLNAPASTQVIPTRWVSELAVDTWHNGSEYFYTLAAYDRTGGMTWEHESMLTYPTIGAARDAGIADAQQRIEWQNAEPDLGDDNYELEWDEYKS
jgi:hypothetical protein